jgi:acyl-CoA synthetase (AMP-forming)/AMP-acid ligase II/3-oxoacyl-(acyl-carrier-protein) synthase/acyl carrier protein
LLADDPLSFFESAWGCLLAGIPFAPIVAARDYVHTPGSAARVVSAWECLNQPMVLGSHDVLARWSGVASLEAIRRRPTEELQIEGSGSLGTTRDADDVAMILLTSGSTGRAKAVPLKDRHLLAMALGTIDACGFTAEDCTLNWLPIDHVGAISFLHMLPTVLGIDQVHVMTEYVLADVLRWLELLERHRASISWSPNFAYRLINDRLAGSVGRQWDLSRVRFLVNAGEAVVPATMDETQRLLAPMGLSTGTIRPAFGMSECCSGITWSRGYVTSSAETALVDLGPPIPGASVRAVGPEGELLEEGIWGEIELTGESVFDGYWTASGTDRSAFTADGWFRTGDLGFVKDGTLTLTGRSKDVIIIHGVHYHAHDIEQAAESIDTVEATWTAALSVRERDDDTDRLVLFFVPSGSGGDLSAVIDRLARALLEKVGIQPRWYVPLSKEEIPRTAIGKIQRSLLKERFLDGTYRPIERTMRSKRAAFSSDRRGDIEERLVAIWEEILGQSEIDVSASFFDLGGMSILLPRLESRMREELGVTVTLADLLAYPSIRSITDYLAPATSATTTSTVVGQRSSEEAIAIVGMAARFPGCENLDAYWATLQAGRETITDFTEEELLRLGIPQELLDNPRFVRRFGWLDGLEWFDADFFGIPEEEARLLDPQQRIFLECAQHALEDAAYDPMRYAGRIGVYASSGVNTYANVTGEVPNLTGDFQSALGAMAVDYMATRASYKLNLRGPSFTVQTACSSALVCVHLACKALRAGECEMALAGAASVWSPRRTGYLYTPGGLVSPDGMCRAFDADAGGMVFGNGVAAVLLKPLDQALRDGDRVRAVIRSTAVNNDGSAKIGFWATGVKGQKEVVSQAIAESGLSVDQIDYLECHGTGTVLGDAIEMTALKQAFEGRRRDATPLLLGSVKTNIGHMGVACGLAGLTKVVLSMEQGLLPATVHFKTPNPEVDLREAGMKVVAEPTAWASPRRAGINSFGLGGTNVHAVVEEFRDPHATAAHSADDSDSRTVNSSPRWYVFPISARSAAALERTTMALADHMESHPDDSLDRVAWTLQMGRREFRFRRALVASDRLTLIQRLRSSAQLHAEPIPRRPAGIAFALGTSLAEVDAEAIAKAWCSGHTIDWSQTWAMPLPSRIGLPGYPFERKYYWLDRTKLVVAPVEPQTEFRTRPADADIVTEAGLLVRLAATLPPAHLSEAIADYLESQAAEFLSVPRSEIDRDAGLFDIGLSSYQFVVLAERLELAMQQTIRPTLAFEYPTIQRLAAKLAEDLISADLAASKDGSVPVPPEVINQHAGLSDDEVIRLLQRREV